MSDEATESKGIGSRWEGLGAIVVRTWWFSGDHEEDQSAGAPNVCQRCNATALAKFGSYEARHAKRSAAGSQTGVQTKVGEFRVTLAVQKHVTWMQIAVDDIVLVQMEQALEHLKL